MLMLPAWNLVVGKLAGDEHCFFRFFFLLVLVLGSVLWTQLSFLFCRPLCMQEGLVLSEVCLLGCTPWIALHYQSWAMGHLPLLHQLLHVLNLVRWPELDEWLIKRIHLLDDWFCGNDVEMLVRAWKFNCKPAWGQCNINPRFLRTYIQWALPFPCNEVSFRFLLSKRRRLLGFLLKR